MASQKADLAFGKQNEMNVVEQLQFFLGTQLNKTGEYAVMDWENPGKTIYVELKSRRNRHDTYPTTLVGLNKVMFAQQSQAECWFCWLFTDGLYYLKYDKDEWQKFETQHDYYRGGRVDCVNRPQGIVYVPIDKLTKYNPPL